MTKKRFRTAEEEMEALRQDPDFRALVEDLKKQTPEQLERLGDWLEKQAAEEGSTEDGRER